MDLSNSVGNKPLTSVLNRADAVTMPNLRVESLPEQIQCIVGLVCIVFDPCGRTASGNELAMIKGDGELVTIAE